MSNRLGARSAIEPRILVLHEFFERQVEERPDACAIECDDQTISYRQLEQYSNQIANSLRAQGVGPEKLVGLCLHKSHNLYAAILGILKAGAGYVPIDPECPPQRIEQIVEDADLSIILSEKRLRANIGKRSGIDVWSLDEAPSNVAQASIDRPVTVVAPNNVCYVIYTSGSTGRPKGVVLEHRSVSNFVASMLQRYELLETDRIYQGFSAAFDASVEEIWAAWASGATLIVPGEGISKSPIDTAEFISDKNVTYFSTIPTFLALITSELPSVRLLILGGEACTPELVSRWANTDRRMLNTYGPTEASVVATCAECAPDHPVTIGTPLAGYTCHVLDDELKPTADGTVGELYIGGDGLARNYMNLPELTGRSFISWKSGTDEPPQRLYRTRDLVRLNANGMLEFVGRADNQVKIRGFRIELTEIETVLMDHPSVRGAIVTITENRDGKEIAAYIVPAHDLQERHFLGIAELLHERLPSYMFPRYIEIVSSFPLMPSGKVDRYRLPAPAKIFIADGAPYVAPRTKIETLVTAVWQDRLSAKQISVTADFFLDLKANSLSVAHVVNELRARLNTALISSRDLYRYRSVESLAKYVDSLGIASEQVVSATESLPQESSEPDVKAVGKLGRVTCAISQLASLIVYYAIIAAPFTALVLVWSRAYRGLYSIDHAYIISTIIGFSAWPSWLALSIAIKWMVVGRFRSGVYPLWGMYYFRWWLCSRFQGLGWPEMFAGSPLMSLYYRAMGARVGKNCCIGTPYCTAFDLVSIGDRTSIGAETQLLGYRVAGNKLHIGRVDIHENCFLGMHCAIGLHVIIGKNARIDDMSLLQDSSMVPADAQLGGSPAAHKHVPVPAQLQENSRKSRSILFGMLHLLLIYAMGYFLLLSIAPSLAVTAFCFGRYGLGVAAGCIVATAPLFTLTFMALSVLVKRLLIGKIRAGTYNLHSAKYLRIWFLDYLMNNTRLLLLPVYATVFFPSFLRMMGAKIGKGAEISTLMHVTPDLVDFGDESFLADACVVGAQRIYAGRIEIQPTKVGRRSFVGNSALVQGGVDIEADSLVGVMTLPPASVPANSRWLGSPCFELTTCCTSTGGDDTKTYTPSRWAVIGRVVVDTFKIVLPPYISATEFLIFISSLSALDAAAPFWTVIVAAPFIAMTLALCNVFIATLIKKVLVGTFRPMSKPLWSSFVWFNELVNGVYEATAAPVLTPLMGTPFIAVMLRAMGCKIGRGVFLETTLFSEFDLVEIGDFASLNFGSTIQTHLFEDRVMKMDHLKIGQGCTVGSMSVVLYGTHMESGSSLAPLSLLMKGETLPATSRWAGIPTQPEGINLAREVDHEAAVYDLSDAEWSIIVPLLPPMPPNGRRSDDRRVVGGIFYILRTGSPWRDLPSGYGPSSTIYGRYRRWAEKGIWINVMKELAARSPHSLSSASGRLSGFYGDSSTGPRVGRKARPPRGSAKHSRSRLGRERPRSVATK